MLCPKFIKFCPEQSANCIEAFMTKYKIPGGKYMYLAEVKVIYNYFFKFLVIGCVDGTHVGLQKPSNNEHMFYNRKGFHSLNAMVVSLFLDT